MARTGLWIGVALGVLCGALWDLFPLPDAQGRLDRIPRRVGRFAGYDISLTDSEKVVLGRVDLVHRKYQFNGWNFFLTVIDGTRDRHAVHDPRYCFEGAGWRVVAEKPLVVPGGAATWLELRQADDRAEAVFWFSDGARRHSSLPWYWAQTVLRRMSLGRSGPEPVMVVLQSYEETPPDWPRLIRALLAAMPEL
ncbi:MAG: exosortase-associated EpsI family protein [Verrucomicrobia bacterium]|nr:exosortase-associated EpsI family protein [Verrucomicrobiota bacterium]